MTSTCAHILVVDDDPYMSAFIARLFAGRGHRVSCVARGDEAITAMHQVLPDAVVLDVDLPGVDGFEVCRRMRSDDATRDVPVVMVTGHAVRRSDCERALRQGANEYVAKPFFSGVLVHAVERHLQSSLARAS